MADPMQTKVVLDESEMPTHWYKIVADLPTPRRRTCIRRPGSR